MSASLTVSPASVNADLFKRLQDQADATLAGQASPDTADAGIDSSSTGMSVSQTMNLQYQMSQFNDLSVADKLKLQQQMVEFINSGGLSRQQLLSMQSAVNAQLHAQANPAASQPGATMVGSVSTAKPVQSTLLASTFMRPDRLTV